MRTHQSQLLRKSLFSHHTNSTNDHDNRRPTNSLAGPKPQKGNHNSKIAGEGYYRPPPRITSATVRRITLASSQSDQFSM
jgi:hypothetical protein